MPRSRTGGLERKATRAHPDGYAHYLTGRMIRVHRAYSESQDDNARSGPRHTRYRVTTHPGALVLCWGPIAGGSMGDRKWWDNVETTGGYCGHGARIETRGNEETGRRRVNMRLEGSVYGGGRIQWDSGPSRSSSSDRTPCHVTATQRSERVKMRWLGPRQMGTVLAALESFNTGAAIPSSTSGPYHMSPIHCTVDRVWAACGMRLYISPRLWPLRRGEQLGEPFSTNP